MNIVIFYEKPGCTTNKKQKKLLRESGCMVVRRNLLEHEMSLEELRSFFDGRPLNEWFNPNAPQIKTGYIKPQDLNEEQALRLLFMEPILIKIPLMIIGRHRIAGFDQVQVENVLNITLARSVSTKCSSADDTCSDKRSAS